MITAGTLAKIGLEVALGIGIKMFCDNGRIHWRDFVNDALGWMPGIHPQAGDGLTRQIEAMHPAAADVPERDLMAAK